MYKPDGTMFRLDVYYSKPLHTGTYYVIRRIDDRYAVLTLYKPMYGEAECINATYYYTLRDARARMRRHTKPEYKRY